MDKLMVDDMPELTIIPLERNDDAVFEKLRDTANPFLKVLINDIRLLKLVMRIVDDDGNTVIDIVPKYLSDGLIGIFGRIRRKLGEFVAVLGKIDVEVVGLNILPLEILVLHLVLPEHRILAHRQT